jgi:pimeloyl-[acyl-carrier protein] synthase
MATATVRFNPYQKDFQSNPYGQYRELREQDPIHKSFMGTWVLTRYRDIESILNDADFSSDLRNWKGFEQRYRNREPVARLLTQSVLNNDPPIHTCLRKSVVKAFAPKNLGSLSDRIAEFACRRLDMLDTTNGEFDAVAGFAVPFPVEVVADVYGVAGYDRAQVKQWSVDVSALIEPLPALSNLKDAEQSIHDFEVYLRDRLEQGPVDNTFPSCMADALEKGDLNLDETLANLILMFPAGHETTINLIGNGIYSLLRNPDQLHLLRERPELMESAVEEMLRYESPQQVAWRSLLVDREVGGIELAKGEQVMMILGAANRDPEVFADPDRFDITRRPNPHLGFGAGRHTCLGSWFAKLQAKIGLRLFLERFPRLELTEETPVWHSTLSFHGLKSLPVRLA